MVLPLGDTIAILVYDCRRSCDWSEDRNHALPGITVQHSTRVETIDSVFSLAFDFMELASLVIDRRPAPALPWTSRHFHTRKGT